MTIAKCAFETFSTFCSTRHCVPDQKSNLLISNPIVNSLLPPSAERLGSSESPWSSQSQSWRFKVQSPTFPFFPSVVPQSSARCRLSLLSIPQFFPSWIVFAVRRSCSESLSCLNTPVLKLDFELCEKVFIYSYSSVLRRKWLSG